MSRSILQLQTPCRFIPEAAGADTALVTSHPRASASLPHIPSRIPLSSAQEPEDESDGRDKEDA